MTPNEDSPGQAAPAKCRQCSRPMDSLLVCDYCHTLSPAAAGADHFILLGLPVRFDVDEELLRRKYLLLSRHAHPDFHGGDDAEVQELHLRVSANLNDAYRTLRDPAGRAAYLLELLEGSSSAQDKSVPDGFLNTMMMMQEEIADAVSGGEKVELDRIRGVLRTQHDGLLKRIAGLFAEHAKAVGCEFVRKDLLGELRKQINAVSYVKKLLSQAESDGAGT